MDPLTLPPMQTDPRTRSAFERIRSKINELVASNPVTPPPGTSSSDADTVDGYHHDQSLLKTATPTFAAVKTNAVNIFSRTLQSVVTFSFDDGHDSVLTLGKPVFDAHGVAATAFIVTDWIGTEGKLTVPNLNTLFSAGWEIASHTKTHADLTTITPAELTVELAISQSVLRGFGFTCRTLAYPYGSTNATVRNAVKQYYELARRAWGWGGVDWQTLPLTSFRLSAIGLDGLSLVDAKAYVDAAVGTNIMLNFFGHQVNAAMVTLLDDLITYIESKNILIVTYEDAIPLVGNVFEYESSDEADRFTVGADSRLGTENLNVTALTAATVCAGCPSNFRAKITARGSASLVLDSGQIELENDVDPTKRLTVSRHDNPNVSIIQSWWTSAPHGSFWPLCLNPGGETTAPLTAVTGVAATDIFTKVGHGLVNGNVVILRLLVGGTGLATESPYYVIAAADNTFRLSLALGGASVDFTTDVTSVSVIRFGMLGGNVGIGTLTPGTKLAVVGLPSYATDALAGTGGLTTGDFYTVTGTSPLQLAVKI